MAHERNKPNESWVTRAKREIENEDELIADRIYEVGRIEGRKECIEDACDWLYFYMGNAFDKFRNEFREAMTKSK